MSGLAGVPLLARRRIEAEFARTILAELEAALGSERARELVARAARRAAREAGASFAAEAPAPSLGHFATVLAHWREGGALETTAREAGAGELAFDVTACAYAEMYRALGLAELGAILSCNRDAAFSEGYARELEFRRTTTIMGGARCCDFRYRWREDPAKAQPPR
ncbi:MAG: L-2-amino-thiazoline-4-carboxylic acid hydrolase [Acetobacteraceae bacterium]